MHSLLAPVVLTAVGVLAAAAQEPAKPATLTLEALRAQRHDLAFRPRGIIANNDGCDVLYYPKAQPLTAEGFLAARTTALAGTQVGAIAYCTISSGFSFFTHATRLGTVLDRQPGDYKLQPDTRNVARELIDQGRDCLRLVVDFAHAHGQEAFWSMRMDDTHDVEHRPDKPYMLYPPLKEQHPEWLVGDPVKRTRYGRWSSVNYAVPEIRDLAYGYIEEVCRTYDVDGIELDFFRHLCFFPSTANGGQASDAEREMMTELVRRVRTMTEAVGQARGRPLLVAIRVPDSVGFCRDLGLDLERWLADGLADILVTTCYFRLNPWEASVELGHRYGVAVYPCLSDSRVTGGTRFGRQSLEALRGEAAKAWLAGADGIHVFNEFHPGRPLWKELGSADTLRGLDKLYFVNVRDGSPAQWLANGERYNTLPALTPGRPLTLESGAGGTVELAVGDDLAAAGPAGPIPAVTTHVRLQGLADPSRLTVSVNGQALASPTTKDDWLDFPTPAAALRPGVNRVAFALAAPPTAAPAAADEAWTVRYEGGARPAKDWLLEPPGGGKAVIEARDGALLVADRGTGNGEYAYFRHGLAIDAKGETVIEARLKVLAGVSSVIFGTGTTGQRLRFYPDRVEFYHDPTARVAMDTTSDFHVYRLVIRGEDAQLLVDGQPKLEGKGCFRGGRTGYRSGVSFGAANSPETGEALWSYVRARSSAAAVVDLVVAVRYPRP